MNVGVQIEVVGCPTVCMHCWAQGVRYAAMPLDDIRYVLEMVRGYCEEKGYGCSAFPMHEVAAHPEAPAVLALFRELAMQERFEPLATTGVPIALQDDWPAPWQDDSIRLVCRPNLDLHTGKAGVYGPYHGNLRTDGVTEVMTSAIATGIWSDDRLCFGTDALPSIAQLARTVGDNNSTAIHFGAHSIRNLWLDRARSRS